MGIKESTFNAIESQPKTIISELFALAKNIKTNQSFPIPMVEYTGNHQDIYDYFNITKEEMDYINANL